MTKAKFTATLKDWRISDTHGFYRLMGKIYDDAEGRFEDSTAILTSRLRSIDFEKGIAKTKNSTYKLEEC